MNLRPLLIVPPIVIAVAVFSWMNRPDTTPVEPVEPDGLAVRVLEVEPRAVRAEAQGYGRVEPVREWNAVAEVQGRVTFMAEGLAVGTVVDAGDVLVEIDRTDYELAQGKALSNIASVEAQLVELAKQEENTRRTLEVEDTILNVTQAEYERVTSLVESGTATQAALDTARKALLAQTQSITNHKNTLALYPAKRQSLEATLAVRKSELAEAERSISKAVIRAPFRGRVAMHDVEEGQFIRTGDKLLALDDISAVEITAEVQPGTFGQMLAIAFTGEGGSETVVDTSQAIEMLNRIGVSADVRLAIAGADAAWEAEIVRMRGTMDSETGALGLVVRVEDPMVSLRPLNRPPLNVGMFVEVTFRTQEVDGLILVPRSAVHYGSTAERYVFVVGEGDRLERRDVEVGSTVGSDIQVLGGLSAGDRLLLSDPQPPVPGMLLTPVLAAQEQ